MLPFNKNTLKHFTYHWFWGLQCHESEQLDHLTCSGDDAEIAAMIKKQVKIDGYTIFFKFFYWLFNIDGYASNFYKLAAAAVTQLNEQEHPMKEIDELVSMPIRAIGRGMNSLWKRIWASKAPARANSETNSHESEPVIVVIEMMQKDLKLLDLLVSNGSRLPYEQIKQAYRKRALEVHPDKGGSAADFQAMQEAFIRLHKMAFSEASGNAEYGPFTASMNERLAQLLREVNRGLAMAEASSAHSRRSLEEGSRSLEEGARSLEKTRECIARSDEALHQLEVNNKILEELKEKCLLLPGEGQYERFLQFQKRYEAEMALKNEVTSPNPAAQSLSFFDGQSTNSEDATLGSASLPPKPTQIDLTK